MSTAITGVGNDLKRYEDGVEYYDMNRVWDDPFDMYIIAKGNRLAGIEGR